MASEVEICNSALVKLGEGTAGRITSLTEGSPNANFCNEQYAKLRDQMLRKHLWNFAKERVKLAQISGEPVSGFDYRYQLPSDSLRVVAVHDNDASRGRVRYEIKGDRLLSDANEIYLIYVRKVTDPNEMDPLFRECLAIALAEDIALAVTGSQPLQERMRGKLRTEIATAKSADAIEDWPEEFPESSWVLARERNPSGPWGWGNT